MPNQLDLFAEPAAKPFYFVATAHDTGEPLLAVRVRGDDRWGEAEKWCYLAAKEHREKGTVEGTRTAYALFYGLIGEEL